MPSGTSGTPGRMDAWRARFRSAPKRRRNRLSADVLLDWKWGRTRHRFADMPCFVARYHDPHRHERRSGSMAWCPPAGSATRRHGDAQAASSGLVAFGIGSSTLGTGQSGPPSRSRMATIPAVCPSGSLNTTLIDKRNWTAAFQNTGGRRPGPPERPSTRRRGWSVGCAAMPDGNRGRPAQASGACP